MSSQTRVVTQNIGFSSTFFIAVILVSVMSSRVAAQAYAFGASAFAVSQGPTAMVTSDFNGDGRSDMAVITGSGVSLLLGKVDGSFAPHVDYPVSEFSTVALAAGDFTGDGKPDLVILTSSLPTVEVLLNKGDGTFGPPTSFSVLNPYDTSGIAVGDFNKDGKLDIAIACSQFSGPVVSVFLGNGNGTFGAQVDYPTASSHSVVGGDFNGDGKVDLAVSSGYMGGGGDTISILIGKGDGTFNSYLSVPVPGNGRDSLAAGDLNRDGKLDLIVGSGGYPGGMSVLLGNGDGSFASAVFYLIPYSYSMTSVAIADFNGDKKLDIVAADYTDGILWVWLANGDGTFKSPKYYPASIYPVGVVAADFNGDGLQDIASAAGYIQLSVVTVLAGKGDGTFTSHVNRTIPPYPYELAVGDFNGDGKSDLVVDSFANPGSVSILLGNGKGGFAAHTDRNIGNYPSELATGDFNGDGRLDVVVSAIDTKTGVTLLSILLGKGDGTLQPPLNQTLSSIPDSLAAADFDLDGRLDVAAALQLTNGVSVFFGNGDGTLGTPILFNAGGDPNFAPGPVFAVDLNGDGRPDLVATNDAGTSVLLGNGNRSFQPYKLVLPGYASSVGDFNGDGKIDLITRGPMGIGIALGNGDGTFQSPKGPYSRRPLLTVPLVREFVNDFNGDGRLDYAYIDSTNMTLSILPGNGDGTFGQRIDLPTENSSWALAAADFTGDGGLDIAVANASVDSNGTVSVYKNRPVASLFPNPLKFTSQQIGTTSAPLIVKLYNSGGAPLVVSTVSMTGDYEQINNCSAEVAVGTSCTFSVTFTPTRTGKRGGKLTIKDNSTVKPQIVVLSGVGVK